jgi:3-deoxy-D-manno-octulosonic-acid transferase
LRTLYNVLFHLLIPVLLLRICWRERRYPKHRRRWRERFAWRLRAAPAGRPVWIHAVSVGETVAASPLIDYLLNHYPTIPILLSTTTATGAIAASRRFGDSVSHVLFPYDMPWVVSAFLSHYKPQLLILMETELWPNLLARCAATNLPVVLANARLSRQSASRYKYVGSQVALMLQSIDCLAAQSSLDRDRLIALGADSQSVTVTGSIKFDVQLPPSALESGQSLRRVFGVNRAVIIAGSTRDGEEEIVLKAFSKASVSHPGLLLLLAPRHPERFASVSDLCRRLGFQVISHSESTACGPEVDVCVIDSIGELPKFYAASDIAFVGGSIVPKGGHNVLEPAALGIPVIVGPYTENFSEIVDIMEKANALNVVSDTQSLEGIFERLLSDSNLRDASGAAGKQIVKQNKGAAMKIVHIIDKILESNSSKAVQHEGAR